ncbi:hypothetical protein VOLCADRAFT_87940 [Volvox carteri f. nagariensis]|uniref:N-acetyltransferase domain-containing protein n=1 Tax=Volvox carteri f. nagariensis TaxID=3068 RepID=D8TMM8_VOLCA|nr:uncharacterized protein VOLCADRAFT_87940 [Volvox carteri f. nagariensis]EFJ51150.1 hypothetical protein VOLCADRAFT_87940 [Volvox carteri f. nagariensis]|eukprot:XP_002947617.1 hypothetical protein VOLCADRAFT_87940 [Volvox carteri f. nagariensis]
MGARTVTLKSGAVIRIRPYRPDDRDQVIRIFSQGMLGLAWPDGVGHVFNTTRLLRLMACAAPAAALLVTAKRSSFVLKAVMSLGGAAFAPCLAFGILKKALKQYVRKSINGPDLSDIETFYSAAGAGHGSAFWVAELLEPEVPSTAPHGDAMSALPSLSLTPAAAGEPRLDQRSSSPEFAGASAATLTVGPSSSAAVAGAENKDVLAQLAGSMAAPQSPVDMLITQPVAGDGVSTDSISAKSTNGHNINTATPAQPVDADEHQVRELVAGLVAAAVARIEGVQSPSQSPSPSLLSPRPTSERPLPERPPVFRMSSSLQRYKEEEEEAQMRQQDDGGSNGPSSTDSDRKAAAAGAPPAAASGPETPAVESKRLRIGSPLVEPTAKPSPPIQPRQMPTMAVAAEAQGAPPPRPAAVELQPRSSSARRATIIGHVALERKSWKLAELRRMSVLKQYAGQGVGGQLLETLVQHARDVGFRELVLYTSGMQPAARRLYERGGWQLSQVTRERNFDFYTYTMDLTKKR